MPAVPAAAQDWFYAPRRACAPAGDLPCTRCSLAIQRRETYWVDRAARDWRQVSSSGMLGIVDAGCAVLCPACSNPGTPGTSQCILTLELRFMQGDELCGRCMLALVRGLLGADDTAILAEAQVGGWVGGWGWSCGWQAALCDPWSCPLPALFLTLQLPKKDSPCPRRCAAEHPGVCLAPHPWCSQRGWPWQMPWQMMHWSWSPPAATCWRQSTEQGAVDISSSSSGGWRMVPAAGPSPAPPCQERQKRQPRKKL